MLATTLLYLIARLVRIPAALRAVEWVTIPAVRRVVDGAVAVSIATATIAGPVAPALAQVPTPIVVQVDEQGNPVPPGTGEHEPAPGDGNGIPGTNQPTVIVPPGLDRIGWTPQPAGVHDAAPPTLSDAVDTLRAAASAANVSSDSVVVVAGDHLWAIAQRHLEDIKGSTPDDAVTARYWRRVIDANRERLRSGDPDLIYPGETVLLPPIDMEDE